MSVIPTTPTGFASRELPSATRRRVGPTLDESTFRRCVLDHLLYTCAKDAADATTVDFYRAMAHTIRDRLVQRWIATQRTYANQDVKKAHYLSS